MTLPASPDVDVPIARDARVEKLIRSLTRLRLAFLLLAVLVPAGCYGLFERQAQRLDALGDHGERGMATVTDVNRQGTVFYTYVVGGARYTWNVAHDEAPYAVGETFALTYLPEDPSFNRPEADRSTAFAAAASNRSFAWKTEAGIFGFFAFNLILCDVRLRRMRKTGRTELTDARAYRTRLILTGAMLVPLPALVFGWHTRDVLRRGESPWPVVLGVALVIAILGGVGFYALREGPAEATARSARILRWAAPLAIGLAALRALAWVMGWQ
jgi:hypothetical protein